MVKRQFNPEALIEALGVSIVAKPTHEVAGTFDGGFGVICWCQSKSDAKKVSDSINATNRGKTHVRRVSFSSC